VLHNGDRQRKINNLDVVFQLLSPYLYIMKKFVSLLLIGLFSLFSVAGFSKTLPVSSSKKCFFEEKVTAISVCDNLVADYSVEAIGVDQVVHIECKIPENKQTINYSEASPIIFRKDPGRRFGKKLSYNNNLKNSHNSYNALTGSGFLDCPLKVGWCRAISYSI